VRIGIVTVGLAAALLLVHHPMILSGFARVQTGVGDTRFNMYAVEHTYLWLISAPGHKLLWNWPVYYPHANVAAYSDLMLGLGPLYWTWRLLGAAPDTSFQLWMLACTAANFLVAYIFLRNIFRVGCLPAAFGALLFAGGSCRAAQLGHQQLLCHLYVMTAIYAVFRMFDPPLSVGKTAAGKDGKGGIWFGVLCASVALQLYTAFYPGFFLILVLGIALAWSMAFASGRREVIAFARRHGIAVGICLFVTVLAMLPWLKHYWAAARELGPRPYAEVRALLPRVESWFFMGPASWWYGWIRTGSFFPKVLPLDEQRIGMGLLTPVIVLTGLVWSWRRRSVRIMLGTTVTVMFLVTYVRWFGLPEPWRAVFAVVPGAGAIRAVARVGMLLLIPASLGLALFLERMLCAERHFLSAAALAVACACILEQGHTTPSYDKRAIRAEVARLAEKIDPGCEAFFDATAERGPGWSKTPVDAMWAGWVAGKPTLNGFSGSVPPGWYPIHAALLSESGPDQRRLSQAVARWLRLYGLSATRICWIGLPPPPPQPPLPVETDVGFQEGQRGVDFLGRGFWNPGPAMCWSEGDSAEIVFNRLDPAESNQRYRLALRLTPFAPSKKNPQRFTVFLNGKRLAAYSIAVPGETQVAFDFASDDLRAENVLLFRIAAPRSPWKLGQGEDARLLGVGLLSMRLHRILDRSP
jgi:hypothetical protein